MIFGMKTKNSKELFKKSKEHIAGGVNSPVRAFKSVGGTPIFFRKSRDCYLYDEDGNKYIDFVGSWGPMVLGHSNKQIVDAIRKQATKAISFGAPTKNELEIAKIIKNYFPSMEKIRMVNSGTEATMSAIRLARGFTGKNKIIKFDGCYHGHVDSLLIKAGSGVSTFGLPDSPGVPAELAKLTYSLPYNNIDAFKNTYEAIKDDLAAVIVEPIAGNMGFVPGIDKFLQTLRSLTEESGSLLIFDEVMSGFRVSLGGAQEVYDIKPDLTALGKVIGGGLPVGAFGGSQEIMDYLAPEGPVYQAGTLSGNPLAMSAGSTLLNLLISENPYPELAKKSQYLLSEMSSIMQSKGIPFCHNHIGGMFGFFFTEKLPENFNDVAATDDEIFIKFLTKCLLNGVYFAPSKFEAGFISTTHSDKVIDDTLSKVSNVMENF